MLKIISLLIGYVVFYKIAKANKPRTIKRFISAFVAFAMAFVILFTGLEMMIHAPIHDEAETTTASTEELEVTDENGQDTINKDSKDGQGNTLTKSVGGDGNLDPFANMTEYREAVNGLDETVRDNFILTLEYEYGSNVMNWIDHTVTLNDKGIQPKLLLINGGKNISDEEAVKFAIERGYITQEEVANLSFFRTDGVRNSYLSKDDQVKFYHDYKLYVTVLLGVVNPETNKVHYIIKSDCGNIITPIPEAKTSFSFIKQWVGGKDSDIPGYVNFELWRKGADGKSTLVTETTLTNNKTRTWQGTFENLPLLKPGEKYYVREKDSFSKWTVSYPDDSTVVNTYKYVDVIGQKVWAKDNLSVRPKSIKLALYQDGKVIKTVTITEKDGWECTFKDLPAGHNYQLVEQNVPAGYKASSSTTVTYENGREIRTVRITNTYNGGGGGGGKKLEPKSDKIEDYGAIPGAPKAPTTELTDPPKKNQPAAGESKITDSSTTAAPNLTADGAINQPKADSDGGATTTITKDSSGDVNKDYTNNVGDESIDVNIGGTIYQGNGGTISISSMPDATNNSSDTGSTNNPVSGTVSGDD